MVAEARLQGSIIGEAMAERFRPDLAAGGLGNGNHGFEIAFVDEVDASFLPAVTIHASGGDVLLPRTNLIGLQDFLGAVNARFPGTGRSRSVHGGLWIDRTDASRLLLGRIAAGATPADLLEPLGRVIDEGVVVLGDLPDWAYGAGTDVPPAAILPGGEALAPIGNEAAQAMPEALPDLLVGPAPLAMLRALFDDNPMVTRAVLIRDGEGRFEQPSTAEDLPSPAECVLAVLPLGAASGFTLDVVRGSHTLPEFNGVGQSRWTTPGVAANVAVAAGASVESLWIRPGEMGLVGAGTIWRLRTEGDGATLMVWCVPTRQSARRILANDHRPFQVRHESGAMVSV